MPEILQTGRLVMSHISPWTFKVDARGGAVVLEADRAADIDLVDRNIAITISHSQHSLYLASQAYCLVITASTNWMFQRHILRHADRAI